EFACRLLESGAALHDARDFLGHANLTTTSRYTASSVHRLERALERMEGSRTEVAQLDDHGAAAPAEASASDAGTMQDAEGLGDSVAGGSPGDRTRDSLIKSQVLYH